MRLSILLGVALVTVGHRATLTSQTRRLHGPACSARQPDVHLVLWIESL
jgi:hypothetical protein